MIKIVVAGFKGRMGATATKMVLDHKNFELVGVLDPFASEKNLNELNEFDKANVPVFQTKEDLLEQTDPAVWIDLTTPNVTYSNVKFALEKGVCPVVGTTGYTEEQVEELKAIALKTKTGGLIAPNFAIGAVLMMEFAKKAVQYFPDVEIIELHHDKKLDAPSGTAIKTAEMMAEVRKEKIQGNPAEEEILAGARGANYQGMRLHSVRLPGLIAHQQVQFGSEGEGLTIRHDSYDRSSFMHGISLGCEKVVELEELVYGLEHLL